MPDFSTYEFMDHLHRIFGVGRSLSPLQMSLRAVVVATICLILVRFSGRRLFGMGMAIDNVMGFLLAGVLSRAIVGVSPFFSTIAAAVTICFLYRFAAWACLYNKTFNGWLKGEERLVYHDGEFIRENMKYCRISEIEILEGIRLNAHMDNYNNIKSIYVERSGRISVVLKENLLPEQNQQANKHHETK
jgi:uncharacterized membrane protein YcaP (DUF421 family)